MGLPHYVVDDYIVLVKLLIVTTLHGPTSNYCLCPKAPLCRILGWEGIHPKHHIFHRFYSGLSGNLWNRRVINISRLCYFMTLVWNSIPDVLSLYNIVFRDTYVGIISHHH